MYEQAPVSAAPTVCEQAPVMYEQAPVAYAAPQAILRIAGAEAFVAGSWPWTHYDLASVMLACAHFFQMILRIAGAETFFGDHDASGNGT